VVEAHNKDEDVGHPVAWIEAEEHRERAADPQLLCEQLGVHVGRRLRAAARRGDVGELLVDLLERGPAWPREREEPARRDAVRPGGERAAPAEGSSRVTIWISASWEASSASAGLPKKRSANRLDKRLHVLDEPLERCLVALERRADIGVGLVRHRTHLDAPAHPSVTGDHREDPRATTGRSHQARIRTGSGASAATLRSRPGRAAGTQGRLPLLREAVG
jgi:hypothetical protein